MEFEKLIQQTAILALPLIFAITLSEAARGHVAYWLGDKTGWSMGRVTWNPANHVSPIETIVIPLVMFFATQGAFIFGSAKQIPIDYRNLRGQKNGALWLELASPIALFLMALGWYVTFTLLHVFEVLEPFVVETCKAGIFVCLSLFAFQLLPIPPLAGGRILLFSLPPKYAAQLARIEPWSVWLILGLALLGVIGPFWISPITQLGLAIVQVLAMPVTSLLN